MGVFWFYMALGFACFMAFLYLAIDILLTSPDAD